MPSLLSNLSQSIRMPVAVTTLAASVFKSAAMVDRAVCKHFKLSIKLGARYNIATCIRCSGYEKGYCTKIDGLASQDLVYQV